MASTTVNMSLKTWDSVNDLFSHSDLKGNFDKLDTHDHTSGKGVQIPAAGIANLAIGTAHIQDGAVTNAKLATSLTSDYEYAFSSYRMIRGVSSYFTPSTSGGTYLLSENAMISNPAALAANPGMMTFYFDPADYAATPRTTRLRVRVACLTNATAPTVTTTVGLYPITATAGASTAYVQVTMGTVVSGSTVTFANPGALSRNQGGSGDFVAPAAGYYALGIVVSGPPAPNSTVAINAQLQLRNT